MEYKEIAEVSYNCAVKRGLINDDTKQSDQVICIICELGELLQACQRGDIDKIKNECADVFIATCVYMKISSAYPVISHEPFMGYVMRSDTDDFGVGYIMNSISFLCDNYDSLSDEFCAECINYALYVSYAVAKTFDFDIDDAVYNKMEYNGRRV